MQKILRHEGVFYALLAKKFLRRGRCPQLIRHPTLRRFARHQADARLDFAASNAARRSANLPFAAPARAMMVGTGTVS
jgi:hypothetical protein